MKNAILVVTKDNRKVISLKETVIVFRIYKATLSYHIVAYCQKDSEFEYLSNIDIYRIFSTEEEQKLAHYKETVAIIINVVCWALGYYV